MKETTLAIIALLFLLVLFGVIFGAGYFLGQQKIKVITPDCPSSFLDSKLIENWIATAKGKLKEISGSTLTLNSGQETLQILTSAKTEVKKLNPVTKEIEDASFEDIKVGDELSIQLTFNPKEKSLFGAVIIISF